MKKTSLLIAIIIATIGAFAQSPSSFKYQTVVRDFSGNIMANHNVSFQFSILQGTASGSSAYTETHSVTTNEFGLVNLNIGGGTTTDDFSTIDWSNGPFFIKVELDENGGTAFSEMGTSQLLSVPYAMYANDVENKDDADADATNELVSSANLNGTNLEITDAGGTTSVDLSSLDQSGIDVDDADADPNNEFQTISKTGSVVTLSNSGGSFTDEVNDADADSTNELVSSANLNGTNLEITDAGGTTSVDLSSLDQSGIDVDDADADPNNELQTISKTGSVVTLSNSGGSFTDEVNDGDISSTNELQIMNFSNDTLYLDNGGQVFLGAYSSLWEQNDTNIYYNNGWVGVGTSTPSGKMVVQGDDGVDPDSALFEVKNKEGQTIFAVYDGGVRIWVDDTGAKGNTDKGGFAVGGYRLNKSISNEYLRVTPDSVRVYIKEEDGTKGNTDKGGFAVGGYRLNKSSENHYFNINPNDTATIINPSEARIYWYPLKEAFMSGRVLVEDYDSVGTNSWASGFESKSIGDYSQALGYRARAKGNNSTAIGNYANATGNNSYAFGYNTYVGGVNSYAIGDSAFVRQENSYAIGKGAQATGKYSFAVGSQGVDYTGEPTAVTKASGDYSYAFGMGSVASEEGAFAFGTQDTARGYSSTAMGNSTVASGDFSTAMGVWSRAEGEYATAIGMGSIASGWYSTAMGNVAIASGESSTAMGGYTRAIKDYSTAMGNWTIANGWYSTSMGYQTIARSQNELAIGRYNDTIGLTNQIDWIPTDPLFVIGNGSSVARHNAMTVLKNGYVGIGTVSPILALDIEGGIRCNMNATYDVWIQGGDTTANMGTRNLAILGYDEDSGDKLFINHNSEYSGGTILGGNVGIGTSTPDYTLDLEDDGDIGGLDMLVGYNDLRLYGDNVGGPDLYIAPAGNVGIGTSSPTNKLTIAGGSDVNGASGGYIQLGLTNSLNIGIDNNEIQARNNSTPSNLFVQPNGGSFYIHSGYLPNKQFIVDDNGNVAIGLSTPTVKLQVLGNVRIDGDIAVYGTITNPSDIRYKKNITQIKDASSIINKINGVSYNWKTEKYTDMNFDDKLHNGVIAQDLQKILPNLVKTDKNGFLSVSYIELVPILIEANKEQQQEIENQKLLINDLLKRVEAIERSNEK